MQYVQITSATGWVYLQLPVEPHYELIAYPVAVWALNEEGKVTGLISVPGGGSDDKQMGETPRLVPPPPLRGIYKHDQELNELEKKALTTNKPVKAPPGSY